MLLFLTYSFQNAEVGSNLIKATSTRATALKEKEGHVYCQPEVLYEGRIHSDTFFLTERPRTPLCDASLSCRDREEHRRLLGPQKRIWGSFLDSSQHL